MKTRKLWWSLLATLMLPLAFALTACDDDDDDKDGGSSSSLANTAWYGYDGESGQFVTLIFYSDDFSASIGSSYYEGDYKLSSGAIKIRNIAGSDNDLKPGTYDYKIRGRKGDRELVIYDIFPDGGDMYLEEVEYEGSGSDDDWDYDW